MKGKGNLPGFPLGSVNVFVQYLFNEYTESNKVKISKMKFCGHLRKRVSTFHKRARNQDENKNLCLGQDGGAIAKQARRGNSRLRVDCQKNEREKERDKTPAYLNLASAFSLSNNGPNNDAIVLFVSSIF